MKKNLKKYEIALGERFCNSLDFLFEEAYLNSKRHKFWAKKPNYAEKIALIHSELSEALETLRSDPDLPSTHIPEFTVFEEEISDVFIRLSDLIHGYAQNKNRKMRIGLAIEAKMNFNANRPPKHGKKF